jgi:hypothetical protein
MSESRFEHWFPELGESDTDARDQRFWSGYQHKLANASAEEYAKNVVECRRPDMDYPDEVTIAVRNKETGTVTVFRCHGGTVGVLFRNREEAIMTTPSFANHVFHPWHAQDDRRIVAPESHWREPLAWNLAAEKSGERVRVMVGCEVFEDWQDRIVEENGNQATHFDGDCGLTMVDMRQCLFDLIDRTPHVDWLIATEKPENVAQMMPAYTKTGPSRNVFFGGEAARRGLQHGQPYESTVTVTGGVRENIWLGTIVSTQAEADARIPALLKVPAAVRWVWCRGMMEEIVFDEWIFCDLCKHESSCGKGAYETPLSNAAGGSWFRECRCSRLNWLAISCQTGPDAHPTDLAHVRSVVKQCEGAGVPVWSDEAGLRQLREVGR